MTRPAVVPHVLVVGACQECRLVLADPDEAWCGNDTCTPSWTIECPGTERGGCLAHWECRTCPDAADYDAVDDRDGMAHGVEHQRIGGYWMVPGMECWVQIADSTSDAVQELIEEHDLKVGRFEVYHDVDDECVKLTLAAA